MFGPRQVRRLVTNPAAIMRVARVDGLAVGWAVGLIRQHRTRVSGRLYGVAVYPTFQGIGLGRRLVESILRGLADRGAERIYLEVRRDNTRAIALYRSLGFVHHADLPGYYGRGVHGVRMLRLA